MSHGTHADKAWMSHVPLVHQVSRHNAAEWVMSHLWMRHVSVLSLACTSWSSTQQQTESCHTYEWGMNESYSSHTLVKVAQSSRMSHVTHTNEAWINHAPPTHQLKEHKSAAAAELQVKHAQIKLLQKYLDEIQEEYKILCNSKKMVKTVFPHCIHIHWKNQ